MADIIYNTIFLRSEYPLLRVVYDYFINMATVMTPEKLTLPLTWLTPAGLKITQRYHSSPEKTVRLSISFANKRKTLVSPPAGEKEWDTPAPERLNKGKQKGAIIPNVIHSLDASHLMQVVPPEKVFENNLNMVLTVHDCFGTHPPRRKWNLSLI